MKIPQSSLMNSLKISSNWKVAHYWKQKYLLCFPATILPESDFQPLIYLNKNFLLRVSRTQDGTLNTHNLGSCIFMFCWYIWIGSSEKRDFYPCFQLWTTKLCLKRENQTQGTNGNIYQYGLLNRNENWSTQVLMTIMTIYFFPCKMIITFSFSSCNSEMWEYKVRFIIDAECPIIRGWINKIRDIYMVKDCRIT